MWYKLNPTVIDDNGKGKFDHKKYTAIYVGGSKSMVTNSLRENIL